MPEKLSFGLPRSPGTVSGVTLPLTYPLASGSLALPQKSTEFTLTFHAMRLFPSLSVYLLLCISPLITISLPFLKYLQIISAVLRHATHVKKSVDFSSPFLAKPSTATVKLQYGIPPEVDFSSGSAVSLPCRNIALSIYRVLL